MGSREADATAASTHRGSTQLVPGAALGEPPTAHAGLSLAPDMHHLPESSKGLTKQKLTFIIQAEKRGHRDAE